MKLRSLLALGALAAGAAYLYKNREREKAQGAACIGIIGGADGPTAILVHKKKKGAEKGKAAPKAVVIATNNAHKVDEFKRMLEPMGYQVFSLKDVGLQVQVEENGETFEENALIKARAVYALAHCPVIADDSGLCVDALGGAPGVYSARYGGEGATDHDKNLKVLEQLSGVTDRSAKFVCAIAYLDGQGKESLFVGECPGRIGFEERGEKGFGYDPIFMVGDRSIAQLPPEEKDAISHRGNAIAKLTEYLGQE